MKNVKNLLIPYILGYTLTWAAQIWLGNKMDYELLRPSGTVMWYVLALFAYRLTIEASVSYTHLTIDGKEIESCGDTCVFVQNGLEPEVDFSLDEVNSNGGNGIDVYKRQQS